ncbi:MAG: hypothetical protein JSW41_01680 [Candidatus Aenigmatarchaeota archaeon]|nr:MAG: hypothetical protein JSW41_01680 [Candidatus Aenigmarchaeota archaeon]
MVEFEVKEIVEVLLVAILGIVILFFVVGGGGRMGPLWDKFCEWMPQLCGEGNTTIEYKMATQSASGLTCAINAVIMGDKNHGCLSSFSGSLSSPSISGLQTAPGDATQLQPDASVSCEDGEEQDLGEINFIAKDINSAADYCKNTCEEDCSIQAAPSSTIQYTASQKEKTLLRCNCYCDGSQEGSVIGLVGIDTHARCRDKCGSKSPEIKNCHNIDVDITYVDRESVKFYNDLLEKNVEIIPTQAKRCICKNKNDPSDQFYYFIDSRLASDDFTKIDYCAYPSGYPDGYDSDASDCSDLDTKLLFYKDNIAALPGFPGTITPAIHSYTSTIVNCERKIKTIKCTVHDFKLPQKVGDVQTYIINYGDPKFILYWNKFPIEEDTWTFKSDWKVHALIAAFAIIPGGRATVAGAKVTWTALRGPSRRLVANTLAKEILEEFTEDELIRVFGTKFAFQLAREEGEAIIREYGKAFGKKELKSLLKQYAKVKGKKYFAKIVMKEKLISLLKERFKARNIKSILIKGVTVEAIYAVAIIADSMSQKYDPRGNNMILKSPYEDAELLSLESSWEGKPVVVKWRPNKVFLYGTAYNNAHLVSPCYLKYIDVTKENVNCKRYIKYEAMTSDEHDDNFCDVPKADKPDNKAPTCGVFDVNIDKYINDGTYDRMSALLKLSDKKIFEQEPTGSKTSEDDDIMELKKIYFPMNQIEGKMYYAIVGAKTTGTQSDAGGTYTYDYYAASLYDGSNSKIKNIVMRCHMATGTDKVGHVCRVMDGEDLLYGKPYKDVDELGGVILYREIETGRFTTQQVDYGHGALMLIEDCDEDDVWDTVRAKNGYDMISLAGIEGSTYNYLSAGLENYCWSGGEVPESYLKMGRGCDIRGIVIDLTKVTEQQKQTGITGKGENYCVRHLTDAQSWVKFGIQAGTAIGSVAAGFLTGGLTYIALAGVAALEVGTEMVGDYQQRWPGPR